VAPGTTDLIFWPGLIGRAPEADDGTEVHIGQARTLASHARSFVIQANWPNSLNYPDEGAHAGQSVVIDPSGNILLRLPRAEAGIAVFDVGSSTYAWQRHQPAGDKP